MLKFTHRFVVLFLIVQLILPSSLLASNTSDSSSSYIHYLHTDFNEQESNLFKLLTQSLKLKGDPKFNQNLATYNLSKPEVFTSIVEFRNLKELSVNGSELQISFEGSKYIHSIDMITPIKDIASDDDFIIILTLDGLLHCIDVFFLSQIIFCAPCPVFTIARLSSEDDISSISFLKRRFIPLDQRISVEKLNLSSSTNSQLLDSSVPVNMELLKSEFNSIKYIPIASNLIATKAVFFAGDLSIISKDQNLDPLITQIIPRAYIVAQTNKFLILYYKLQSLALEPSFTSFLESMQDLSLQDIERLFPSYLEGISGQESLNLTKQVIDHSNSSLSLLNFRDVFTPKEWEDDSIFFSTLISSVENKSRSDSNITTSQETSRFQRIKFAFSQSLKQNFSFINVSKFASFLKTKTFLSGLILCLSLIEYINFFPESKLSVSIISGIYQISVNLKSLLFETFPILKDSSYLVLLSKSIASQLALMFSIYFIARIVAPFTQYKYETIPPLVGSKIFKNLFMISPFRLISKLTGNLPLFLGLKKGVFPDDPTVKLKKESKAKQIKDFSEKIKVQRIKNFLHNALLTQALILIHKFKFNISDISLIDTKDLQLDLKDPLIKSTILHLSLSIQYDLEQLDLNSSENLEQMIQTLHQLVSDSFSNSDLNSDLDKNTSDSSSRSLVLASSLKSFGSIGLKGNIRSKIIRLIFNYNEGIYKTISQVAPNSFTSSITKRQFFTNYTLSMIGQALAGNFADPTHPEHLMAQPHSAFYTSAKVNTFNFQKIIGHIGKSPIATNLIFKEEARRINKEYYPAEFTDIVESDMNFTNYPFFYEFAQYGMNLFNIRDAEPGKLLVRWLVKSYLVLFQATIIIGCIFRIWVGHQPVREAVLGIFLFSACSSFVCNWPWTMLSAAQYIQDNKIKSEYKNFVSEFIRLKQSIKLKDFSTAKNLSKYFNDLYTSTHMNISKDIRKKIEYSVQEIISSPDVDTLLKEAENLTKLIQNNPPVAKSSSETVSFIYTAIASLSSAFLLSFLITKSFDDKMHLWGISKSIFDINLFTHIPEDGVIPLILKSAVLTLIVYLAQDAFNVSYDYFRYLFTKSTSPKKEERKLRLELSNKELKKNPLVKMLRCVSFFSKK